VFGIDPLEAATAEVNWKVVNKMMRADRELSTGRDYHMDTT
jgi:hypothetical protein